MNLTIPYCTIYSYSLNINCRRNSTVFTYLNFSTCLHLQGTAVHATESHQYVWKERNLLVECSVFQSISLLTRKHQASLPGCFTAER